MAKKNVRIDYYSYEEYLEKALHGQGGKWTDNDSKRSSRHGSESWTGTRNWEDCVGLVENGWPEGTRQVAQILTRIKNSEEEIEKPQILWDVEGDMVDIGRYVSGEPECMMRWEPEKTSKRIARILFPISVSGGVSTELMRWRGACVLALIDKLEAEGVRAHVDICYASRAGEHKWLMIANVKRPDEVLYVDRMAFHLAHPSSFRRVMFSLAENGPDELVAKHDMHGTCGGYGMPIQDVNPYLPKDAQYDLVVPGVHLYTVDQAVKEMEKMLGTICPDIERTSREWDTDAMVR